MTKKKRNRIRKTGVWILAAVCMGSNLMGCAAKEKKETATGAVSASSESERQEKQKETKQDQRNVSDRNVSDTDKPETLNTTKPEPDKEKNGQGEKTEPETVSVPDKAEVRNEKTEIAAADIRDYLEDIFGFIDALGLEKTEAGALEQCYQKGSVKVDLSVYENETIYSISDDSAEGAAVYGADVGMTLEEVSDRMQMYGWRKCSDEIFVSVINGKRYYLAFHAGGQDTVQNWYLCNWPEGENIDDLYEGLEPKNDSGEEQTRDICDYIWDIRGMIEVLELQETEPAGLNERYERNGIELDFSEMGYAFTVENNGEDDLTVCGVRMGDSAEKAENRMETADWVKAEGFEGEFINVIDGRYFNCSIYTDGMGAVTGWRFCNWPEGDGDIMMQLEQLEQERKEK